MNNIIKNCLSSTIQGHSEFQAFTDNPTVQSEFLKIAEKLYLKDVQQDIPGARNAINSEIDTVL